MFTYFISYCVNVLINNKNDKYVYKVINNNYNLSTCITSVMTWGTYVKCVYCI